MPLLRCGIPFNGGITEKKMTIVSKDRLLQLSHICLILTGFCIPISITATDIMMAATVILGILSGELFRNLSGILRNPLTWCVIWFVLLVIISMLWSIASLSEQLSALHKYFKLLYIPLLLPLCTDSKCQNRAIFAFIMGVLITVIFSFLKAWAGLHFTSNPSPSAVFFSHIETSFFVAFGAYFAALQAWRNQRWRWFYVFLASIFTYQEFFINDGRTGWIAYLILLILFVIQLTGWKGVIWGGLGAIILLGSFYYFSPTLQVMVKESAHEIELYQKGQAQTSLGFRLSFDSLGWRLVKERPLLGYGAGSFAAASNSAGGVPGWGIVKTPHNEYLMVTVEFGVLGLISLLLLFFWQWRFCFRLDALDRDGGSQGKESRILPLHSEQSALPMRRTRTRKRFPLKAAGIAVQGFLLVFMISSLYNAFLYSSATGHFYVFFTALFFGPTLCFKSLKTIP